MGIPTWLRPYLAPGAVLTLLSLPSIRGDVAGWAAWLQWLNHEGWSIAIPIAGWVVLLLLAALSHNREVHRRELRPDEVAGGYISNPGLGQSPPLAALPGVQTAARSILKQDGVWPRSWQLRRRRGGITRSEYEAVLARETRAQQIVDEATVAYRGTDWGDPLYSFEFPTLQASVDFHAFSEEEARGKAVVHVAEMLRTRAG